MSPLTEKVIWTALPNGVTDEGKMRISVFVSPRLTGSEKAKIGEKSTPLFYNWPQVVNLLNFSVLVQGEGETTTKEYKPTHISHSNSEYWKAIFPEGMQLFDFEYDDYSKNTIYSYSIGTIVSNLKETYTAIAKSSPTQLPRMPLFVDDDTVDPNLAKFIKNLSYVHQKRQDEIDNILKDIFDPSYVHPVLADLRDEARKQWPNQVKKDYYKKKDAPVKYLNLADTPPDGFNTVQFQAYLAQRFHKRPDFSAPVIAAKDFVNFYQMISMVGDYPQLMRDLGLVIDLEIENIEESNPNIRIKLGIKNELEDNSRRALLAILIDVNSVRPKTCCIWKQDKKNKLFIAKPKTKLEMGEKNLFLDGQLKLNGINDSDSLTNGDHFALVQIDPDGAILKNLNFTYNMQQQIDTQNDPNSPNMPYNTPDRVGLPTLRSGGLALIQNNRAYALGTKFEDSYTLFENLNDMGDHLELFTENIIRGYRIDVFDIEKNQWYSLCARNGNFKLTMDNGDEIEIPNLLEEGYIKSASATQTEEDSLYLYENLFQWDGWSLCVPRPGKIVKGPEEEGMEEVRWNKAEETDSNLLVQFSPVPGTLPRLRYGRKYKIRVRLVDLAGNSLPLKMDYCKSHSTDEIMYARFEPVAPPVVLQTALVTEGESVEHLVIRSNYNLDSKFYIEDVLNKVVTNKLTPYFPENMRVIIPPKTSQLMAEMHGKFDKFMGQSDKKLLKEGFDLAAREAKTVFDLDGVEIIPPLSKEEQETLHSNIVELKDGQYLKVEPRKIQICPYLPDVFARGVAFQGLPGMAAGAVEKIWFAGNWPDLKSFQIILSEEEKNNTPFWDSVYRTLTIYIPKGEKVKIKYSCFADKEDIEQMGIYDWLKGNSTDDELQQISKYAQQGMHWMLTPFRELTLVHALQQPLKEPKFTSLEITRKEGALTATLTGKLELHAPSTEKVDVLAEWYEWVDDLSKDGPERIAMKGHAAEKPITYDYDGGEITLGKHEFGDNKFRLVQYRLRGTTRYREYFPTVINNKPTDFTRDGVFYEGIKVKGNSVTDGTTPIFLNEGTEQNLMPVLNTARPEAPRIDSIVPTFGWERNLKSKTSTRKGGGLRVFLERPWFSSGDGEMLGVVLFNKSLVKENTEKGKGEGVAIPTPNVPDELTSLVTKWGKDPVYGSPDLPNQSPSVDDFSLKARKGEGLVLDEMDYTNVHIHEMFPEDPDKIVGNRVGDYKWTDGWTQAKPFSVNGKDYLFLLKEIDGTVHIHKIKKSGEIGTMVQELNWTGGWTSAEFFDTETKTLFKDGTLKMVKKTFLLLHKKEGLSSKGKNVHIYKMNDDGTVGEYIFGDKWTENWTHLRTFKLEMDNFLFLSNQDSGVFKIYQLQDNGKIGSPRRYKGRSDNYLFKDSSTVEIYQIQDQTYLLLLKKETFFNGNNVHILKMEIDESNYFMFSMHEERSWSEGWTQAKPFKVGDKHFLFLLKEGDGTVHINEIISTGNEIGRVCKKDDKNYIYKEYAWTNGWSTVEFYHKAENTFLFLLKKFGGTGQENIKYNVDVAAHKVEYDTSRKLWYADIVLAPKESYNPFVRLALARYQPNSVGDASLSRVVLCDFMQLLPDRTLEVKIISGTVPTIQVSVSGIVPNNTGVLEYPKHLKIDEDTKNEFTVQVQKRAPLINDADIGWIPLPYSESDSDSEYKVDKISVRGKIWAAKITLKKTYQKGEIRVMIKEFEYFYEDDFENPPFNVSLAKRLVYADSIEL